MKPIELESVSKCFNGKSAVVDFSIQVEKGERVVLLGPSGCGKTTLLRMLAGLLAPDEGRIFLDGVLVAKSGRILRPPEERALGMVFQDLALWPHLSVSGNIQLGLKAHGLPGRDRALRVGELLELVEMTEYADAKPSELSGGQQQRVALARALALRPKLLLMDEPLSNLDLELNIKFRADIIRLQQATAFTLVYITHDPEEALDIGTRIVMMREGRIEQVGKEKEVREYFEKIQNRARAGS